MALWRGFGASQSCSLSPEATKAAAKTVDNSQCRRKRPKRLTCSLKGTRREGLKDCTNRLTASYNASTSEDYVPPYGWFCPEQTLLERRCRTDQRREELLQLLYQEEESEPGQIDDLVTEWVSLLVERDKLLHEQVNKEICTEYFRELHRLLRAQPSLGTTAEEINIREVLMDFERCVTEYCRERNILTASQRPLACSNTFAKPMFFHAPPELPGIPTTLSPSLEEEEPQQQQQQQQQRQQQQRRQQQQQHQHNGHLLDQETGQASVHIEAPPTEKEKSPFEDDSSGSLFKEAAAAEIPVSESLQVSQASMVIQSKPDTNPACDSIAPGKRRADESAPAGQGSFDSPGIVSGRATRGLFDCLEEESGEGLFDGQGVVPGRGLFDSRGVVSRREGQGLLDGQGVVSSRDKARPTATRKAVTERSNLLSTFSSSVAQPPPRPHLPPPRPLLPPVTSTSPPPLPPSPPPPHLETISPTHRVMPMKGGVSGTVQFAGMATNTVPPPRQSAVTTWKKRLFGIGKDEPDKGAVSVRTEDRQNLLDEISTMGHGILKRTNRPRSPGGTPVKEACANPAPDVSTNSDMLQRALMTKFRSLHSTPLSHSRFMQQDYSASLDFSNAWSDSIVFEDPDISASSISGLAISRNDSSKISNNVHNGSSAV